MSAAPEIVRLNIKLDSVKPTVMRRIDVPIDISLDLLHEIIQAVMPWGNYHGYGFHVRDTHWGIPPPPDWDLGFPVRDATQTTLADALAEPNFKALRYTYDFGDDWCHTIKVERRFSAELWQEFPRLIDAKGRCPPEDVGGPWGYAEYLAAMSDPGHARHAQLMGWLGRRDPNEIDRAAMDTALSRFVRRPATGHGRSARRA